MKLWGGRFEKETTKIVEAFTASIHFDKRLVTYDIAGSIAHCNMLEKCKIISLQEKETIINGLNEILIEVASGTMEYPIEDEDIHMCVEKRLIEKVGKIGGKIHTARSRNDQVALDMHIYLKVEITNCIDLVMNLQKAIIELAEKFDDYVMPGYTHLQRAQPVLFSHHVLAYFWMLQRDSERLKDSFKRADVLPLGAGALAGTTFPIDREMVARELGFKSVYENSMDAVADRDFVLEFMFTASLIMVHLSRFSEDLILWNSSEFGFIELDDAYTTGSSIMPQKKNPDVAELVRGKCSRTIGNLMGTLTMLKGLPMSYNRDMQEDKESVFDTIDTVKASLAVYKEMILSLKPNKEKMRENLANDFSTVTDLADYLAKKGMPFRDAHSKIGSLVSKCIAEGKKLEILTLKDFKEISELFEEDCLIAVSPEACVKARDTYGGTSASRVKYQIEQAKSILEN